MQNKESIDIIFIIIHFVKGLTMQIKLQWFLLGLMLFLVGCSHQIQLNLQTDKYLNPNAQNQSLPVEIKIYQLTQDSIFSSASFEDLWLHDKQTLGKNTTSVKTLIISPNNQKQFQISRDKQAQYLGVIAIFRQPNRSHWKMLWHLSKSPINQRLIFSLKIQGLQLTQVK